MTLVLTLRESLVAPVDAEPLGPDRLARLSRAEIERVEVRHGNRPVAVGELFDVSGDGEDDVRVEASVALRRLGAGMTRGRLVVAGDTGPHTGARMSGGELVIEGDAGDFAGAELRGGRLVIAGSAGDRLGGVYGGARAGMRGGEIMVRGDAGEEVGAGLRRGLIAVGGRAGAGAGLRALAGTIIALGGVGGRPGMAMRRASIVASAPMTPLPTYALACTYRPAFLALVLRHLREHGLRVGEEWLAGRYARWSGDRLDLGRGEILVLEP